LIKRIIFLLVFAITVAIFCIERFYLSRVHSSTTVVSDLSAIRKRGKLIAVTNINSTDYFIFRGETMGFNYELLKSFSDNIGIDLEVVTENHIDKAINMLNSGAADLLAFNLAVNPAMEQELTLSAPICETRQVLIQRKPRDWKSLSDKDIEKKMIRNPKDLVRKTIYVQAGSTHAEQLFPFAKEIRDSINVIEVPFGSEKLIQHVADGEIDYSICDENIASVVAANYPGIDVNTTVSFPHNTAWGLRKERSDTLKNELNRWINSYRKTESFALLYAKYFRNSSSGNIVKSDYYSVNTGKVSQYDDIIRKFSSFINWDWRLLASLICQESHFNPKVESITGAVGLMQVMPVTGKYFGIDVTSSPENNIKAGIEYINWLHSIFDPRIPDEKERISFILAAYNAGPGHVLDAMNLAAKNGMDPLKWDGSVALWLAKKSDPKYYNDIVVKNGYFKGIESVAFVSQILDRYEHYKNLIPRH